MTHDRVSTDPRLMLAAMGLPPLADDDRLARGWRCRWCALDNPTTRWACPCRPTLEAVS